MLIVAICVAAYLVIGLIITGLLLWHTGEFSPWAIAFWPLIIWLFLGWRMD